MSNDDVTLITSLDRASQRPARVDLSQVRAELRGSVDIAERVDAIRRVSGRPYDAFGSERSFPERTLDRGRAVGRRRDACDLHRD